MTLMFVVKTPKWANWLISKFPLYEMGRYWYLSEELKHYQYASWITETSFIGKNKEETVKTIGRAQAARIGEMTLLNKGDEICVRKVK